MHTPCLITVNSLGSRLLLGVIVEVPQHLVLEEALQEPSSLKILESMLDPTWVNCNICQPHCSIFFLHKLLVDTGSEYCINALAISEHPTNHSQLILTDLTLFNIINKIAFTLLW